jgi:hypothetical protein
MAKVKIQGHASGTGILTVTAPNTSTDRTITLPDSTGTLLNSDGSAASLTSIPAAQITGTLPAISGASLTGVNAVNSGRKNMVYNGAMKVAQRSTSVTGLGAANIYATLDRWHTNFNAASAGRFTMAQVADAPAGFANSLKLTTTTADTSIAAGEILVLGQNFEGQDLQHLEKGTATAKQITVSFYVKGNANATYTCELYDRDNTRTINQAFAVTTAWNRVELTFAADTSDPLDDDNGSSLSLGFILHGGTTYSGGTFSSNAWKDTVNDTRMAESHTSIFDATSRTFFITGVQMEIGSVATDFEHRSYGEELALCQRYYQQFGNASNEQPVGAGVMHTSAQCLAHFPYLKEMRTTPTISTSGTGFIRGYHRAASEVTTASGGCDGITKTSARLNVAGFSSGTGGGGIFLQVLTDEYIYLDAEL